MAERSFNWIFWRNSEVVTRMKKEVGLLPWEVSLLFFVLGCLGYGYPVAAFTGLALLVCVVGMLGIRQNVGIVLMLGCLGFVYTFWRIPAVPEPSDLLNPQKGFFLVSGKVVKTAWRFKKQIYVYAGDVRSTGANGQEQSLHGLLLIAADKAEQAPLNGQRFHARIKIRSVHSLRNPGCWDGETYWHRKGVYWKAYVKDLKSSIIWEKQKPSVLEKLRRDLRGTVMTILPDGNGKGLLLALLLGDRSHLTYEMHAVLQHAGIVHSLALSGLHLGFVATFGWGAAWLLGFFFPRIYLHAPRPHLAALLAFPPVLLYMWLGGFSPSLQRAGIMLASWGALVLCNRGRVLIDGLFIAVLVIVFWQPAAVFSISLQFSVLAVTGIIFFVPPIQKRLQSWSKGKGYCRRLLAYCCVILTVSLAANLVILPIQVWNFGSITGHLYYNIVWLPALGFIVLPLGFAGLFLARLPFVGCLGHWILEAVNWFLENGYALLWKAQHDGFLQTLQVLRPHWTGLIGFYILLGLFLLVWKYRLDLQKKVVILLAVALCLVNWSFLSSCIKGMHKRFSVVVIDTGMSQAVYLSLPGGKRVLIDGGGSWSRDFDMGKAVIAPVLTWGMPPAIDAVFLTHGDCDHLRGLLYPLETCRIGKFYFNGLYPKNAWDRKRLVTVLEKENIPVQEVCAGQRLVLEKNVVMEVLHPGGDLKGLSNNDSSLVLRIVINGKGRVLVPGDIEKEGIDLLLAREHVLDSEVLILPHHGSRTSYSDALYGRVHPRLAIAAAGLNNRYGFPADSVTEALKAQGCPVLTTAACGAIECTWENDQNGMHIHTMRECVSDSLKDFWEEDFF